ncbi:MAG: hypothetical protein WCM76_08300 [Bacteroidota bacterium]
MTVFELKQRLIQKINHTKNNRILEEVYRLLENEETDNTSFPLSDEQKNAIAESQVQYRNGQIITGEQADKDVDEWLKTTKAP